MGQRAKSVTNLVVLRSGMLELALAPEIGGSIAWFDRIDCDQRIPVMRKAAMPLADAIDAACFPLVPFANRIRNGSFHCDGQIVELEPNLRGDSSPMHGQGWRASWQVEMNEPDRASLALYHDQGLWPWRYLARQQFTLTESGLCIQLSCQNLSLRAMPCGLGFHPYFPGSYATVLDAKVESAWTTDAYTLPDKLVQAEERFSLSQRTICGADLDNLFEGWAGNATISASSLTTVLTAHNIDRLHVYAPAHGDYFAVEPVQCGGGALNKSQANWTAAGITMLEQFQTMSVELQLHIQHC